MKAKRDSSSSSIGFRRGMSSGWRCGVHESVANIEPACKLKEGNCQPSGSTDECLFCTCKNPMVEVSKMGLTVIYYYFGAMYSSFKR
ncbi:hypothetical protein MANES_02G067900v8 [Manihot esculenta]|uniref:Uncharacterized protein n=1 Tax=Manihot esculenta TaxID=3983 RepID=A0A2C9WBI1_MANES|nr:hypothetical protein MANES_02G067900v8 [Manihot esculenta]